MSAKSFNDDGCGELGMGVEGMKPVAMPEAILISRSAACTETAGPGMAALAVRCPVNPLACTGHAA